MTPPPTRAELVEHLVATRVAGDVATDRYSNLGNIHRMLAREPEYWFGLELDSSWTFDDVLKVMTDRVGIDDDPARASGPDRIDPELCADALDAAADRLARAAAERATVLLATGHPTGLLALHMRVAAGLAAAGCRIVTPAERAPVDVAGQPRRIVYVGGVATLSTGADLLHTHAAEPMHTILGRSGLGRSGPAVDLVVADHGWAGAAAQAGLPTIGFADTNDPALFVGAAEGKLDVVVPLDDNVSTDHYTPVAAYLLRDVAPALH